MSGNASRGLSEKAGYGPKLSQVHVAGELATSHSPIVILFDVDNTLIDNDQLKLLMDGGVTARLGKPLALRFWAIYEEVRAELGHVDIPLTLRRLAREAPLAPVDSVGRYVTHLPFRAALFPHAIDAILCAHEVGCPVIVTDGDPIFQGAKVRQSGIEAAVSGNVLIYFHKEEHIDDIVERYLAASYWMVDDKARLLGKFKARLGERLTTVHVRVGQYRDRPADPGDPQPDWSIDAIGDLPALLPIEWNN